MLFKKFSVYAFAYLLPSQMALISQHLFPHLHNLLGLSTLPYTATAVLLTVGIRSRDVPYVSRIYEFGSPPRRYGKPPEAPTYVPPLKTPKMDLKSAIKLH